jgi:hypothetical protein
MNQNEEQVDWLAVSRESLQQKVSQETNDFKNAFATAQAVPRPVLKEHIFKNVFLPMFAGLPATIVEVSTANWIAFAGSGYVEVDVVANDNDHQVLFTVPPLFDAEYLNPGTADNSVNSVKHVLNQAQLMANNFPIQGEQYLVKELSRLAAGIKHDSTRAAEKYLPRWAEIFNRYGIQTEVTASVKAENKNPNADTSQLDYDFVPP